MKYIVSGLIFHLILICPLFVFASIDVEQIYFKQCATCHGNNGDGRGRAGVSLTPPATNFNDPIIKNSLTHQKIVNAILNGVPGTSMVAYARRIDEKTAAELAEFIQVRFMGKTPAKTIAAAPEGRAIYDKNCSACHGDNGNTAVWAKNGLNPPPRNFTSKEAQAELSRERMILSVTHGRPGTAMMPFEKRLSQTEIEAVVDYIRQTFMQVATVNKSPQEKTEIELAKPQKKSLMADLTFPRGLRGDATKGKEFYNANCFVCHGKKGDGNGPRAHFNRPRPRNFTSNESKKELDRPTLFKAISKGKRGTVMPAWETVLTEQQIANVAEYVFQTFIQPPLHTSQKKKF